MGTTWRCCVLTVTFEEALKLADDLVFAKTGRRLSQPEKIVMEGAWHDLGYEEIGENSPYSVNYLQRTVAPQLWNLMSEVFGDKAQVGKKKLRYFLEQVAQKYYAESKLDTEQLAPSNTPPYILGGQPPDVSGFYGRTEELTIFKELVVKQRCVALIGTAGIGKSALAAKVIQDIGANSKSGFDCFVWKSVHYAPSLENLVTDLIGLLASPSEPEPNLPIYTQAKVSVFLKYLQSQRCLVVLDGVEAVLKGDRNNSFNPYGEHYAEYGIFFRRIVEELQQSCLVLTSREPFNDLNRIQLAGRPCYSLKLEGLDLENAMQLLHSKGLTGEGSWEKLIQTYLGNPLALELIANRIQDFFGGNVETFFECQTSLMSDFFQESLHELFGAKGRLTNLEKRVALYLASELEKENADSIEFTKLLSGLKAGLEPIPTSEIIRALEALGERALLEKRKSNSEKVFFALQPVVKKYVLRNLLQLTCSAA